MKTIKIEDKEISIPESHTEIKLSQFEKLIGVFSEEYATNLDRSIDLLLSVTTLTLDEIESLDLNDFRALIEEINGLNFTTLEQAEINEFEIDGVLFKARSKSAEYKFTVKETSLLQNIFVEKKEGYLTEMVSILFHPVVNGELVIDYSKENIQSKKNIFKDITIEVVTPFILELNSFFITNLNVK